MKRLAALLAIAVALAACSDAVAPPAPGAPALQRAAAGRATPGEYIVVFAGDVADAPGLAGALVRAHGGTMRFTYEHVLKWFAAALPQAAVAALQRNPNVAYIEEDQEMAASTTQSGATWGIDRIDQRNRPLSGTYTYNATGAGVRSAC